MQIKEKDFIILVRLKIGFNIRRWSKDYSFCNYGLLLRLYEILFEYDEWNNFNYSVFMIDKVYKSQKMH